MQSDTVKTIGRFAPSPTGELHAGNIFSYLMAWIIAKQAGGSIILRIEDLDPERSKQTFADKIMFDLESLGLSWDGEVIYQSRRKDAYEDAFSKIKDKAFIYPCFCTRADLRSASAPHVGERAIYSRKCRFLTKSDIDRLKEEGRRPAYRIEAPDRVFYIDDLIQGRFSQNLAQDCGDFIVVRADGTFAYQLAVVIDDAASGVNHIVRGVDLLDSSPQQAFLQDLLGFCRPKYAHVPLFVDEEGRRLSKRNKDASLDVMLNRFKTTDAIIGHISYLAGLIDGDCPIKACELLDHLKNKDIESLLRDKTQIVWK